VENIDICNSNSICILDRIDKIFTYILFCKIGVFLIVFHEVMHIYLFVRYIFWSSSTFLPSSGSVMEIWARN